MGSEPTSHQPTQDRPPSRVDAHNLPSPIAVGQLDLVGRDESPSHQIDGVSRQQVGGQKNLAGSALKSAKVNASSLESDAAVAEATDLLHRYEQVSSLNAHHDANNRRVRVVAEPRDQVLDASNAVTVLVKYGTAHEGREVHNICHSEP